MYNQFANIHEDTIDPTKEYNYTSFKKSKGFTLLMRYVLEGHKGIIILKKIKDLIKICPNILNTKLQGTSYTALKIAIKNCYSYSSIGITKLLIDLGASLVVGNFDLVLMLIQYLKKEDMNMLKICYHKGYNHNVLDIDG